MLIIGKMPPPIGGVTIHVQRLVEQLRTRGINFDFLLLNLNTLLRLIFVITKYKGVHLHTSNLYIQLFVVLICKLRQKKSIITFHGDLDRYKFIHNKVLNVILSHCDYPIVLNEGSLRKALKKNSNSLVISSFIPPTKLELLDNLIKYKVMNFRTNKKKLYATNAYSLTYDKDGVEIYGIIDLINYFNNVNNDIGLIISDPSGTYFNYLNKNNINMNSKNILLLNVPHSFFEIIKLSDATIRNTSTDGDSLSVKESLYLQKATYATDIVSRPTGVIKYTRGNYDIFLKKIDSTKNNFNLDGLDKLLQLYKTVYK